jgi:hypothetical protein
LINLFRIRAMETIVFCDSATATKLNRDSSPIEDQAELTARSINAVWLYDGRVGRSPISK